MARRGQHAVVIGASMAGLASARALLGPYDRVTVLDRDDLTVDGPRRGVPQGRHIHALPGRGALILEAMFPGVLEQLQAAGAPLMRDWAQAVIILGGYRYASDAHHLEPPMPWVGRPFLESAVRARVESLPGVELIGHTEVTGLLTTVGDTQVTGVRMTRDGVQTELTADLVLDASGRTGRAPVWLTELGYGEVVEERVPVDIKYVSQELNLLPDALGRIDVVIRAAAAHSPRVAMISRQERGRWLLTAAGYSAQNHPPTEEAALREFAAELLPAEIAAVVRNADVAGPVLSHRFPANLRRRYDKLDRFPAGFLVLGDAMCSFNPLYGQGMTVAALQAESLRACLLDPSIEAGELARRYFKAAAKPVNVAWRMAAGGDLMIPSVPGRRTVATRALNAYVERLNCAAGRDIAIGHRLIRVTGFLDPPTALFAPVMLRAALGWQSWNGRRSTPPECHESTFAQTGTA